MRSHPGDWVFVVAGGVMVAMTHEAYAEARAMVEDQAPDAWEAMRSKGRATGDMIKLALDVLERHGEVRREERVPTGAEDLRWPVYALVPEAQRDAPQLTLVQGGASDPASGKPRGG